MSIDVLRASLADGWDGPLVFPSLRGLANPYTVGSATLINIRPCSCGP